jgi:hypothetical protein
VNDSRVNFGLQQTRCNEAGLVPGKQCGKQPDGNSCGVLQMLAARKIRVRKK